MTMAEAVRNRLKIMLGVFAVLTGLIIIRLISLQFGDDVPYFETQYELSTGYLVTVTPPRGRIFDRSGELLATNDVKYAIGLSPDFVTDPEGLAKILSSLLGRSYEEMLSAATHDTSDGLKYVLIDRPVSADIGEKLLALTNDPNGPDMGGLIVEPMQTRVYPNGPLGSHVLGFVGLDNKGYYGIEEYYNSILAGHAVVGIKQVVPFDVALDPDPDNGSDLYLTVDREIQALTEDVLKSALERYGAEGGEIIVMEPKTGRILAMAVYPSFNPNNYTEEPNAFKPNPAIGSQYEPGSTFKILTMAGALQSGAVQPETTYQDQGVIEVGGVRIYNWNQGAWGTQDMTGALQHSLNVGMAWIATQMGPKNFYDYMTAFGIGQTTNIDLSGESAGRLKHPGDPDWFESDLGTNAFGQGVATTPIQLLTAISAVANGGAMMQPHFLERVVDGTAVHTTQPQVLGRPISADIANTLNEMLAVSVEREASEATVPGYRIAGKTGTAQIPTPGGYSGTDFIQSFVGWGPVDDPQFIVLVKLDKSSASMWGSETAAPTFAELVKRLVVLMNIPPDDVRHQLQAQIAGQ
jgi:cell division protein FtsI/penicillin-binding protein 2